MPSYLIAATCQHKSNLSTSSIRLLSSMCACLTRMLIVKPSASARSTPVIVAGDEGGALAARCFRALLTENLASYDPRKTLFRSVQAICVESVGEEELSCILSPTSIKPINQSPFPKSKVSQRLRPGELRGFRRVAGEASDCLQDCRARLSGVNELLEVSQRS